MFLMLMKLQVNEATGNERCQEHCWSHSCSNGKNWETAQILGLAPQLHIGDRLIVIRRTDKTVSCRLTDAWNKLAKVRTTAEISDKLEGGKLCLCAGEESDGFDRCVPVLCQVMALFHCVWCQKDRPTQEGLWLIRAL